VNGALSAVLRTPTCGRVLLYHEIRASADPVMCVAGDLFREHCAWIAARGLRLTSVGALVDAGYRPGLVGLTFDDGYRSIREACQRIAAAGLGATVFVVPAWIDSSRDEVCDWSELADLARRGIEIGAHDLAHERPCGVPVAVLAERYRAAKQRIEDRLGRAVGGLSFPYGLAPGRATAAAALAGYRYAVTSRPGANGRDADPLHLRRNEVHATDATEGLLIGKLAGTDDWMRPVRAFEDRLWCS
jgi:peptidoglycan/xylan/chitin deacetylase (PgdA/CDA1 family)